MRLDEQIDEQPLDRRPVMADLVIARRRLRRRVLQPVQRALPGQRLAVLAPGFQLAHRRRQHRVEPQLVVIEQVFVAERYPHHPLADQHAQRMLDQRRRPTIAKTTGKPIDQPDRPIRARQQQRPAVRAHLTAVEPRHHLTTFHRFKTKQRRATLCRHRGSPLELSKLFVQNNFLRVRAPMHLPCVRNPG
jgi:hypothetical protein